MAIRHVISRHNAQPVIIRENRDKHAVMTARTEGGVIPIGTSWKTKKSGVQRYVNTYNSFTNPVGPKMDSARMNRLIVGETKGRDFNPLTGRQHFLNKFN